MSQFVNLNSPGKIPKLLAFTYLEKIFGKKIRKIWRKKTCAKSKAGKSGNLGQKVLD